MGRIFNLVLLGAMILAAAVTYDMKYNAETAANRVVKLEADIARQKAAIQRAQGRMEHARPAGAPAGAGRQARRLFQAAALHPRPDRARRRHPDASRGGRSHRRAASAAPFPTSPSRFARNDERHQPAHHPRRRRPPVVAGRRHPRPPGSDARPHRADDGSVRRRLPGHHRPAGDVRHSRQRAGAERLRPECGRRHRPARPRRPQWRDPRHRHQDGLALRRAAQHHRSR